MWGTHGLDITKIGLIEMFVHYQNANTAERVMSEEIIHQLYQCKICNGNGYIEITESEAANYEQMKELQGNNNGR